MCSSQSPWAVSDSLAYGFAAVNIAGGSESSWCCTCYELTFTSTSIAGKKMIVQATNTGGDLGSNQFDLAVSISSSAILSLSHTGECRFRAVVLVSSMVALQNGAPHQVAGGLSMAAFPRTHAPHSQEHSNQAVASALTGSKAPIIRLSTSSKSLARLPSLRRQAACEMARLPQALRLHQRHLPQLHRARLQERQRLLLHFPLQ